MVAVPRRFENKAVIAASIYVVLLLCLASVAPSRTFAIQLMGISLFYGFVYQLVRPTRAWEIAKGASIGQRLLLIVITICFIVFAGWYLGCYEFHPTWDGITYWRKTLQFNESLSSSVSASFAEIYRSINISDYNDLLCWVTSLPVRLFGEWDQTFFAIVVLFYIPAAFLLALFVIEKADEAYGSGANGLVLVFLIIVTMPVFAAPTFGGLLDAPAFLMFVAATNATLDKSLITSRLRPLFVGFAVVLSYLLRRYFVFAAIGLVVASICYWFGKIASFDAAYRKTAFKRLAYACAGMMLAAGLTCVVFPGFYYLSLFGGQGEAYSSWTVFHGYTAKIGNIVSSIGPIWFILPLMLAIYVGRRMGHDGDKWSAQPGISIAIAFVSMTALSLCVFWGIQDLAPQHFWIIAVPFASLVGIPFAGFIYYARDNNVIYVFTGMAASLCAVISLGHGFGVLSIGSGNPTTLMLPRVIRCIPIELDYEQKENLLDYLDSVCSEQTTVYYAAASEELNSYLSIASGLPVSIDPKYRVESADVDSRDGFNTTFFDADYVVTSNPVSIHLDPDNEKVVCELSRLVRDNNSFLGRHYEQSASFDLDNGVTAEVYRRISLIEDDDIVQLEKFFDEAYPHWPDLFRNRFEDYRAKSN